MRALPDAPAPQPATDVRSATPPIFRTSYVAPVVRRVASISALAAIDAAGVTAGLFIALVLREVYYGRSLSWSSLWQAETDWLPFLILVTLLVFAQRRAEQGAEVDRRWKRGRP